jgi:hypothetical protein
VLGHGEAHAAVPHVRFTPDVHGHGVLDAFRCVPVADLRIAHQHGASAFQNSPCIEDMVAVAVREQHVRGGHFVHFDAFGHGIAADERVDEQLKPCDFNAHGAVSVPREFHLLVQRLS